MGKAKVQKMVCGSVWTNCYFLINTQTKEMVIIDPADNAPAMQQHLDKEGLKPVAILLTHGHYDHILAADDLRKAYGIPIIAHEKEKEVLEDPRKNLTSMLGMNYTLKADQFVKDGQMLDLAGFSIQVLFTPGHTAGGCCYYIADEGIVFCGDTLFNGSVGRTDFPTGSMSALIRSIKEKLMVLPDQTKAYPGHEGSTDILYEKENNPYL